MIVVGEDEAARRVDLATAMAAVEAAFVAQHRGEAQAFPVALGHGSRPQDIFAVKSAVLPALGLVGLKVGTNWPGNRALGLPTHGSTTLLLDDATGAPRALVAATHLTALRTAAADGLACDRLARPDAEVLAVVGAGHQAWFEILAVTAVRPIREVRIWSRDPGRAEALAARAAAHLGLPARTPGLEACVRGADIVVTVTAAREPLVRRAWLAPGTHISAMGADAPGKQELEVAVAAEARLFADAPLQACTIGELQAAARAGLVTPEAVTPLGAVLDGPRPAPRDPGGLTLFDSSGIALQDLAVAALAAGLAPPPSAS